MSARLGTSSGVRLHTHAPLVLPLSLNDNSSQTDSQPEQHRPNVLLQ
jgi:hypothetical protein